MISVKKTRTGRYEVAAADGQHMGAVVGAARAWHFRNPNDRGPAAARSTPCGAFNQACVLGKFGFGLDHLKGAPEAFAAAELAFEQEAGR